MWPVLFAWRGIVVRSYHVVIYVALLVTIWLATVFAQRDGLDVERTALVVLISFVPAFVAARLMYAARHWHYFGLDPARILRRGEGGLSLYGGILGMVAGLLPLLWAFGLPFAAFLDALVLAMLAGIAIAKGACLLNGCCYGRPTDHWCGASLPDQGGLWRKRFPSQLLEMAWAFVVLALLLAVRWLWPSPSGLVACGAFVLLPAGRLFLQKLRDEGAAEEAAVRKTSWLMMLAGLVAGLFVFL